MSLDEMMWRVILPEIRDAAEIVAIEEVLHNRVAQGQSPPTLMFYHWKPSVSIGKPQAISDLNLEACKRHGLKVVRTNGGGRAVLHLGEKDVSYSLFSPSNGLNTTQVYERFCGYIAEALKELGMEVKIDNKNDFFIGDKKISGNALRLDKGGLTQHGIIIYDSHPPEIMVGIMDPNMYNQADIAQLRERLTSVKELNPKIRMEDITKTLTKTLTKGNYDIGSLTPEEKLEILFLKQKYDNPNWYEGTSKRGLCWLSKGEPRGSLRGL
ncbi:MAG: hypothetical protein Q8R00_01680 [Candidatus Nanoarchaeia archaeon]|nr:hypothetical protein [Candidatus Nanoarchaeia archaeon]